jgi:hypothetical protein
MRTALAFPLTRRKLFRRSPRLLTRLRTSNHRRWQLPRKRPGAGRARR